LLGRLVCNWNANSHYTKAFEGTQFVNVTYQHFDFSDVYAVEAFQPSYMKVT